MDISLLFPLLILLLFIPIFLSGRRQKRQAQETKNMQAELDAGDVVVTTSGLRGTVVDASYEDTIDLEIADGVVTTWVRAAVRERVNPTADEAATGADGATTDPATTDPATTDTASTEPAADTGSPSLTKDDSTNGTSRS
jgi:preprotein translocase subunit YajC